MASRTAVSALPWHHSMLDVDTLAGLAGATLGGRAGAKRRSALTFRHSGRRNRRYRSRIFHDDPRPRLPAKSDGLALLLPEMLLVLEHELSDAGVLWAEWYSGDEAADRGAPGRSVTRSPCSWTPQPPTGSQGRRQPLRMIWLALTSTGGGGTPQVSSPAGTPKSKSLPGGMVHRMEKSSAGSMSMKDLELPKSASTRRSNDGACATHLSQPREKLSPRC